ncbi:hypothetical protein KIMC2_04520 [Xylocopilactobacillus apis]|uniref:Uncharacterized protein n=1 Tax=Xylocopilactobacillus apis TaxID=2932183 RepID=A0AAU9D897_9LACO|nr:hypothetical protein KIMC2_04520 [Xylocopilactobacillus apis]
MSLLKERANLYLDSIKSVLKNIFLLLPTNSTGTVSSKTLNLTIPLVLELLVSPVPVKDPFSIRLIIIFEDVSTSSLSGSSIFASLILKFTFSFLVVDN